MNPPWLRANRGLGKRSTWDGAGKEDKVNFRGYPPDQHEKATQTFLEPAQLLALDWAA